MAATQQELALQMIAQLRLVDPSVSAEIGSPERKIIDTVGQSLADSQIDLLALENALDLDSKFGAALDRFLALLGFGRQKAVFATGFVTLSRQVAATADIRVPAGTQVVAPALATTTNTLSNDTLESVFATTFDVILPAGELSVVAPVRANVAGAHANVAAGRIASFFAVPIGITAVTNENAIRGGKDVETDDEYKTRFKNTVFRNLAGTQDQYLALAIATAFSTKANVVGPLSRYREYIQVPNVSDALADDVDSDGIGEFGGGFADEYTSALSTIPYSKYTYDSVPVFVSNGEIGPLSVFYRQDVDFRINLLTADRDRGDTRRFYSAATPIGLDPNSATDADFQPNVTFLNVYTGDDATIQMIRPGQVVLFEHSYMSTASRNDISRHITNAVDVFVDGGNDTLASTITTTPRTTAMIVDDPNSKYHYDNYRRVGEAEHRPVLGHLLLPLFWQPLADLPDQIKIDVNLYFKGVHYWAVEDVSELAGTVRARNGIEWATDVRGQAPGDPDAGPYTGPLIASYPAGTPLPIENYIYDRNIVDLQSAIEANRQVTTDVLAHKARLRFFKLDITVMYVPGVSATDTNFAIQEAVQRYLSGLYFGSTVQLSDLLQVVHDVSGVDNVRWSSDVPGNEDLTRIYETDKFGQPLANIIVDQAQIGTTLVPSVQQITRTGDPTSGGFALMYNGQTTTGLVFNANAAAVQSALNAAPVSANVTVTGTGSPASPWEVTFNNPGAQPPITATSSLQGGRTVIMSDFFIKDDELVSLPVFKVDATDTVPGLIIRPRAQNTWTRVG